MLPAVSRRFRTSGGNPNFAETAFTTTSGGVTTTNYNYSPPTVPEAGLGYNSYADTIVDREFVNARGDQFTGNAASNGYGSGTVFFPRSQAYSLWRILSRGPVPQTLLTTPAPNGYGASAPVTQPAVNDPGDVGNPSTAYTAPAADGTASPKIPVATRCVIWVSPFTGDQPLNVPGSLDDVATQTTLQAFVSNGGRLLITGQEVATALTNEGSTSFLNNVLNATYLSNGNGQNNQILAGQTGAGNLLSFDSLFDFQGPSTIDDVYSEFFQDTGNGAFYSAPSQNPLILGNDLARYTDPATYDNWRTDPALTQLGPITTPFGNATVQSRINQIAAANGAVADFSINASAAMIRKIDTTDAIGSGFGSRVIFASFGLEGLSQDVYHFADNGVDFFFPRNQRTNVLHNTVSFLRTGTFTGQVLQGTGTSNGVAGATVYLIPYPNASADHTIPGQPANRQTYSALTADGLGDDGYPAGTLPGTYTIQGVSAGAYRVIAYKNGYTRDESPIINPHRHWQQLRRGWRHDGHCQPQHHADAACRGHRHGDVRRWHTGHLCRKWGDSELPWHRTDPGRRERPVHGQCLAGYLFRRHCHQHEPGRRVGLADRHRWREWGIRCQLHDHPQSGVYLRHGDV